MMFLSIGQCFWKKTLIVSQKYLKMLGIFLKEKNKKIIGIWYWTIQDYKPGNNKYFLFVMNIKNTIFAQQM